MQPKQRKPGAHYTLALLLCMPGLYINASPNQQVPFFATKHHLEIGVTYMVYQPMKVTPQKGPIHLQPRAGHSYAFGLNYAYQHNNYLGLSLGLGVGKVAYAFTLFLEKSKTNHPYAEEGYREKIEGKDLFFCIPITARFNIPIRNKASILFEPGVQITHHPRSLYEFLLGYYSADTNTGADWGMVTIYRNGKGQPIYPVITMNVGSYIKLKYGDFVTIKVVSNIHPEDIVDGKYALRNLGNGNDSDGTITMNTSYIGLQLQYVFAWNIAAYKKHTSGKRERRNN